MERVVKLIILLISISIWSCGDTDQIILLPGKGIVLNEDSILLDQTDIETLKRITNTDVTPKLSVRISDGFDLQTGEELSESAFVRNLTYKSIDFEYAGLDSTALTLDWISLDDAKDMKVILTNEIFIGSKNPNIIGYLGSLQSHDFVSADSLEYNINSQGISFQLVRDSLNNRILNSVSIHYYLRSKTAANTVYVSCASVRI